MNTIHYSGLIAATLALLPVSSRGAVIFEGFDAGLPGGAQASPGVSFALPSGTWFAINESSPIGANGVFQGNLTVFAQQEGAGYAGINFQSGSATSNLSTWLMSPELIISNGDTISYFTRTVSNITFPDRLRVRLSTSGSSTTTADFSTVLHTVNDGLNTVDYPNGWTQFSLTVTGLGAPVSGRFAFHYDVPNGGPNGANSDYIGIDAATFTLAGVPEPSAALLGGVALLGMFRRRRD
jgi:hypothetical protein